jgi:hypothetical protein
MASSIYSDHNSGKKSAKGVAPAWYVENPDVYDEDDPRYLCCNCRHIDFAFMTNRGQSQYTSHQDADLGLISDIILKRNCPFCRLVIQTVCIADRRNTPCLEVDGNPICYRLRTMTPKRGQTKNYSTCGLALITTPQTQRAWNGEIQIIGDAPFEGRRIIKNQADFQLIRWRLETCERESPRLQPQGHEP